jgi:hypothetical protein
VPKFVADSVETTGLKWVAPAAPTFVGCSLTKSVAQSIANTTDTMVSFNVEDIDTDGFHDNSVNNERITIPSGKGGKYLITAQTFWADNSVGNRQLILFKNTTSVAFSLWGASANPGPTPNLSFVVSAVPTDYFLLKCNQNTGGALDCRGNSSSVGSTYFTATFLGA